MTTSIGGGHFLKEMMASSTKSVFFMRIYFVRGGALFPPFFKVRINLAKRYNTDKPNK
jgi:hypothetical protein